MSYDVFISYSQAGDSLLAERVQDGLARFAKPWWRRHALSVFRDRTSLTANPGLWSSIADAIDDSRFFVLLASPEAAVSPWCAREVEQWRSRHGGTGLLVLLTDGEIVWDEIAGDFDWQASTALTPALAGCFSEAPRYVDMRWARSEVQLDLTDGRFRDQITELAAPIHGMSRDELAGANVRQHRRTLRHAYSAGIALVIMTLAAVSGFAYANVQKNNAVRNANRARLLQREYANEVVNYRDEAKKATDAAHAKGLALDAKTKAVKDANDRTKVAVFLGGEAKQKSLLAGLRQAQAQAQAQRAAQQTRLADLQRIAGVSRSLVAGSEASLAGGSVDTSLLLAAQAVTFAGRSGGLVTDDAVKPALIGALQGNPRLVGQLRGLTGAVAAVAVAPDGSRAAAVSSDGHVGVWSLPDERLLSTFAAPSLLPRSDVRFLDRNTLVLARFGGFDVYRTLGDGTTWCRAWGWNADGRSIEVISASLNRVVAVTSSLASPSYPRLDMFDGAGHHYRPVVVAGLLSVDHIAFSPSGSEFAVGGESSPGCFGCGSFVLRVFSAESEKRIANIPFTSTENDAVATTDPSQAIVDIRFSRDGGQITALTTYSVVPIHRFEVSTGQPVNVPAPNRSGWTTVVVPDTPLGLSPNLDAIVQSDPNNQNVIGIGHIGADSFTRNIDSPFSGAQTEASQTPAFTPDDRSFLMPGRDGVVPVFDLSNAPRSHFATSRSLNVGFRPGGYPDPVATLSPDGRILAAFGGGKKTLDLVTLDQSRPTVHIPLTGRDHRRGCCAIPITLAFDNRDDAIAVAYLDGSVDVFDANTGALRLPLPSLNATNTHSFSALSFSGSLTSGRIAEATDDDGLWTWDVRSGQVVDRKSIQFHGSFSTSGLQITPSGSRLVVITHGDSPTQPQAFLVHVFDAATQGWTERRSFPLTAVESSALSPDGTQLVVTAAGEITSYDLNQDTIVWTKPGDADSVSFGPDGNVYTDSGSAGTITVRSALDGTEQYTLDSLYPPSRYPHPLEAIALTAGHVITTAQDGLKVIVTDYPLATTDLIAAACNEAGRNLTQAEWKQYVGPDDPYEATCPEFPRGP